MVKDVDINAVSCHILSNMKVKKLKTVEIYVSVGVYGSTGNEHRGSEDSIANINYQQICCMQHLTHVNTHTIQLFHV